MDNRKKPDQPTEEGRNPRYHVYVRLPFNRGDFVDPGPVNWDEKKSEALWSIISDSSLANVNWTELATEFDVSVEFLLQMANYLTERHTSQLRAQMLRAAAAKGSSAPSPVPGAESPATFEPMRRIGSGAGRAPSALSVRKETATPLPTNEEEHDGAGVAGPSAQSNLPMRPRTGRTSSASTAVPAQSQPSTRPGTATHNSDPQRRRFSYLPTPSGQQQQQQRQQEEEEDAENPLSSPAASTSSSSSSSESPVQSRIIRRPPRFGAGGTGGNGAGYDEDDDDDDEPAFLPFNPQGASSAQGTTSGSGGQDLGATLRGDMRGLAGRRRGGGDDASNQSQTSDSSVGSAAIVSRRPGTAGGGGGAAVGSGERRLPGGQRGQQGPLSPRRTAELAGRGLGSNKGKGTSREGSDGTPSMGSSFSDLDDASVTQSALEEALASRMQDGTIGSRMSVIGGTIGQAIRSRYLPKSDR